MLFNILWTYYLTALYNTDRRILYQIIRIFYIWLAKSNNTIQMSPVFWNRHNSNNNTNINTIIINACLLYSYIIFIVKWNSSEHITRQCPKEFADALPFHSFTRSYQYTNGGIILYAYNIILVHSPHIVPHTINPNNDLYRVDIFSHVCSYLHTGWNINCKALKINKST